MFLKLKKKRERRTMTKAQTFWQYPGKSDKWQQKAQIKRPS